MPHLTLTISPEDPLIDLAVGVSKPRADALMANSLSVPPPMRIRALIDTGASCTCVDSDVLSQLALSPTGNVQIHTPSTSGSPHSCNQYDISLMLLHPNLTLTFGVVPVIESNLISQGIQALIGRDLLTRCLFVYDGSAGAFALAF